jgi:putative aldouronate transport system substrate-binding protein
MWQEVPSDGSEAALALSKLETIQRRALPDMIMGNPADFDAKWDAYVNDMNAAGINKYVEFMQERLEDRVSKFGGFPE